MLSQLMRRSVDDYRDLIPIECCARCGYSEIISSLHVHHIDQNHDNDSPDNLLVLCANCHFGLHHKKWKLSEIGIFGFDTKIHRSSFREVSFLKKQNSQLATENKKLKEDAKLLKLISDEKQDIIIVMKKKIALYNLLSNFSYAIRDEAEFFLEKIPDEFFESVECEDDIYTRELATNAHELYTQEKQHSNDINADEFAQLLKVRMNAGEKNRKNIKECKLDGLTFTELMRKLPL